MIVKIYSSGYANLDRFVKPYVISVQRYEQQNADLTIVDNGTPEPYPTSIYGVPVKRTDNLAIMTSFNQVIPADPWDWIMLTDTDVICEGPFLDLVAQYKDTAIYGQQVFSKGAVMWFDGWLFCIPRRVWETVGKFDEEFLLTGAFQDLDYCLRAVKAGFELHRACLPFRHLEANTTHKSPRFWENREYNRRLIDAKHGFRFDL